MTTIYDEDNDEMIDNKTGEPVDPVRVAREAVRDLKYNTANDIVMLSPFSTHEHYKTLKSQLDVIEAMYKETK